MRLLLALGLLAAAVAGEADAYRRELYPHWVKSKKNPCWSVRTEVLVRDALEARFDPTGCTVVGGRWADPYTGAAIVAASAEEVQERLDVDHVIALKETHERGGHSWPREFRRDYANDVTWPGHLVATSARANAQKGAKGPLAWTPRREAWCGYAIRRAVIGYVWDLRPPDKHAAAQERLFLREMLATCRPEEVRWIR